MTRVVRGRDAPVVPAEVYAEIEDDLLLRAKRQLCELAGEVREGWVLFVVDRPAIEREPDPDVAAVLATLDPDEPFVQACPVSHVLSTVQSFARRAGLYARIVAEVSAPVPAGDTRIVLLHRLGINVLRGTIDPQGRGGVEKHTAPIDPLSAILNPRPPRGMA